MDLTKSSTSSHAGSESVKLTLIKGDLLHLFDVA